jgi:hypothetical protein
MYYIHTMYVTIPIRMSHVARPGLSYFGTSFSTKHACMSRKRMSRVDVATVVRKPTKHVFHEA